MEVTEKQRRNRGKAPKRTLTGETLDTWQADIKLVEWAQKDLNFRLAVTVAVNERHRACQQIPGMTENRLLGRVEGYAECLSILQSLANGKEKPPLPEEPTFPSEEPQDFKDVI